MEARTKKGLTIEDVAFQTRIPAARVSELENDDFSNFANLTYAKGFLKLYSSFLQIDIADYLNEFDTRELANIYGHEYIQSANTGLTAMSVSIAQDPNAGRWKQLAILLLIIAALIAVPIYIMRNKGEESPSTPPKTKSSEPIQIKPALDKPAPPPEEHAAPTENTEPPKPRRIEEEEPAPESAPVPPKPRRVEDAEPAEPPPAPPATATDQPAPDSVPSEPAPPPKPRKVPEDQSTDDTAEEIPRALPALPTAVQN